MEFSLQIAFKSLIINETSGRSKQSIPTTTVDYLVEIFNCVPDLVKIDVEGAERLVLQGAVELAHKQVARFLVEMHSNSELPMSENAQRVLSWCQKVNYRAWYLKDKVQLTAPELISGRGRCHLLLLPAEEMLPEILAKLEQGAPLEKVQINMNLETTMDSRISS